MAPTLAALGIQETSTDMPGIRKRARIDEGTEAENQAHKQRRTSPEITDVSDDDDISEDTDMESLFFQADDEENTEINDDENTEVEEPEQGAVLWSEDQEEYPPSAIYHEHVRQHQALLTGFAAKVAAHLTTRGSPRSNMAKLHAEAVAIQMFPETKKLVIALMGDAGSGKSSLINSILDIPHIAKEGNYGSACTCAPTAYMSDFAGQTKKFASKIDFLDVAQRNKLLRDHLREYVHFNFENDPDWTGEEIREYRAQAKTAEETFMDLFRDKSSFNDPIELKSYIRSIYDSGTDAALITRMVSWCIELLASHGSSLQTGMIESDRAFPLRRALSPFLSSGNSSMRKPRLWPLVHKVRIGIKGVRILENVIIVDMPGVNDISRVRVRASRTYLLSCDHLWIITSIGRVVSDTSVDTFLFDYGERFAGRLAIICTKIDDRMSCETFKDEYPRAAKIMDKHETAVKEAKTNYYTAKACARGAIKPSTLEERNRQVEITGKAYKKSLDARLRFMVCYRNQKIEQQIYERKSEYLAKREYGPVFFASNEHYMWLKGYNDSGSEEIYAQLSAELTGIPNLRAHALSIPAEDMWSTLMAHIQHTLASFMNALTIWAARTGADNGDELEGIKEKATKEVKQAITVYIAAVEIQAENSLAGTMRKTLAEVAQKGYDYFHDIVRGWFWSTIRAFVERDGTYTSKAVGFHDWNSKLRQPATRHLNPGWYDLLKKEGEQVTAAESKFKDNLDVLHHDLKEIMALHNIPLGQFGDFVTAQKHGVTRAVQKCRDYTEKELRNVKHLTAFDNDVGYFVQVMTPIYKEAAEMKGKRTGYKNNVMTLLETEINQRTKDSPFIRMADYASNKVVHHAKTGSEELLRECNTIYTEVFNQFGGLLVDSEDNNEEVTAVKAALREYLPTVNTEMAEIIKKLEAIQKDPSRKPKPKTTKPRRDKIKKEEKQKDQEVKVKTEFKQEQQ